MATPQTRSAISEGGAAAGALTGFTAGFGLGGPLGGVAGGLIGGVAGAFGGGGVFDLFSDDLANQLQKQDVNARQERAARTPGLKAQGLSDQEINALFPVDAEGRMSVSREGLLGVHRAGQKKQRQGANLAALRLRGGSVFDQLGEV